MRRLLPLLPQQAPQLSSRPSESRKLPKSKTLTAACEVCRARKTKCDGRRPKCRSCLHRDADCQYVTVGEETRSQAMKRKFEELRNNEQGYKKLFSILATLPPRAAQDVLRRIRSGQDVQAVLRHIEGADLLLQMSLAPELRLRYDFPYLNQMPSFLLIPNNQYLRSFVYEAVFNHTETAALALTSTHGAQYVRSPYTIPYHAAKLVEPTLPRITAQPWTVVDVPDAMVRILLEGYFLHQYPYLAQFHKDLFLEAMANDQYDLCSPLLVNAVLAAACHIVPQVPDRVQFWRPDTLQYQFLAETRRLLELEADRPSLTTIQALLVMHQTANMNGLDKVGMTYLLQAVSMAYDLDLFREDPDIRSPRMRKARAITAWGLFIWQTQVCFYYLSPPLFERAPEVPLPNPDTDRTWYGDIWLIYPGDPIPLPTNLGETMKALATFRTIQNDLGARLHGHSQSSQVLKLEEALYFKARFDEWFSGLGDCLSPTKIVFPIQLKIHMEYYTSIINLLQIFEDEASFYGQIDFEEPKKHETLQTVVSAARVAFETIMRIYYMRHSFDFSDSALTYFLPFMFNMALKYLDQDFATSQVARDTEESYRSTLILSARGLQSHGRMHVLTKLIYQSLKGFMQPRDLDILHVYTSTNDIDEDELTAATMAQAEFPIPNLQINGDQDAARVKNLLQLYQQLHIIQDGGTSQNDENSLDQIPNNLESH